MTRRHGRGPGAGSKGSLLPVLVVAGALLAAGAVGTGIVLSEHTGKGTSAKLVSTRGTSGTNTHRRHHALGPPTPLSIASVSPTGAAAKGVGWSSPITVTFNQALSATSPMPTLSPAVPGNWTRVNQATIRFQPTGNYLPYGKETLDVPASMTSARGVRLGRVLESTFTVKGGSVLRLQELLAELGYLPVSFTPSSGSTGVTTTPPRHFSAPAPPPAQGAVTCQVAGLDCPGTSSNLLAAPAARPAVDREPSSVAEVPLQAEGGTFRWRFPSVPQSLASLWQAGQANVVTTGAVMAFESADGLGVDGQAGPLVWSALLRAAAAHQVSTTPYDYVTVSPGSPEYVTVWRDGVSIYTTLANTGIAAGPSCCQTQAGTWPVYLRFTSTTMSGTNPNGSHYSDPGIPWTSYFHGGDALHGFIRSYYGAPQSLGCVEMPFANAKVVYPLTPYGTLVTVE